MMMKRLFVTFTFSAFSALNVFSQFYSKVILDSYSNSRIISIETIDNNSFISHVGGFSSPDINVEETIIAKTDFDSNIITDSLKFENQWLSITGRNYKIKNDTIFVGSQDIKEKKGVYNWYYSILDKNLDTIYKSSFRLPPLSLYGLEPVKNDEIILWGNGFDPNVQNTIDSIKFVWIRIKKDGTLISGPNYWKPSDTKKFGIATDAATNGNGNLVFIRESRLGTGLALYRAIYEIDENDKVKQNVRFENERPLLRDYARFCVTRDGGYISYIGTKADMPVFIKFDKHGDTIWTCPLPPKYSHHSGFPNMWNIFTEDISRIRQAANGDIIFCGRNSFMDTMYNYIYKRRMYMGDLGGSFFGRISQDGKLHWVHYMVSVKNATDCHYISSYDINEMPNGDLLLGGKIGVSADSLDFTFQAWIMRVNDKGCFDDDCSHVDKWWFFPEQFPVDTNELYQFTRNLAIFPNPFGQKLSFSLPEDVEYPLRYHITNMAGQTLSIGTIQNKLTHVIETGHLCSGAYIIGVKDQRGIIYYKKGIKI